MLRKKMTTVFPRLMSRLQAVLSLSLGAASIMAVLNLKLEKLLKKLRKKKLPEISMKLITSLEIQE